MRSKITIKSRRAGPSRLNRAEPDEPAELIRAELFAVIVIALIALIAPDRVIGVIVIGL